MGEVYRATDTRLGREVALKVLPAEVSQDPERLARFRREAQLLASLNHPGIAAIHGLEEAGGQTFLVLELVEGEDLSKRLEPADLRRPRRSRWRAGRSSARARRRLRPPRRHALPEFRIEIELEAHEARDAGRM